MDFGTKNKLRLPKPNGTIYIPVIVKLSKRENVKALFHTHSQQWYYRSFCPVGEEILDWKYDDGS